MKITNISFREKCDNYYNDDYSKYAMIINSMLQRGMYSDALFDRAFIDIDIQLHNDLIPAFYRLLWEDSYLRIPHPVTTYNDATQEFKMGITISEALGFIFKATPPRLQDQIVGSHKSISDIVASLKTFLMEPGNYINYMSMFCDHVHLKSFDTKVENFKKIRDGASTLMKLRMTEINSVAYIYDSLIPFEDLFKTGYLYHNKMMLCMTTNGSSLSLITTLKRITELRGLQMAPDPDVTFENVTVAKVDNVVFAGNVPYILMYIEYDYGMENELREIIKESYKGII